MVTSRLLVTGKINTQQVPKLELIRVYYYRQFIFNMTYCQQNADKYVTILIAFEKMEV